MEIDLSQLRDTTEFPFSLLIPQYEVEKIFREQLVSQDVHILRNKTAVGLRQNERGGVDVSFDNGSVVNTQYVVGADGSRSTVRPVPPSTLSTPLKDRFAVDTPPRGYQICRPRHWR